ncbi:GMC family oxidoreductase N-terminal domain-containing protein [Leptospira bandrabouensis]|uniref:GMC family oxidoreductase N-terminal domain-containing protein n=1 Tax=Leptospira bandrabouensis TaxID=2484903 RepID=UPI001EECC0A6|nr:GMC family oxidoreductase [Leptospira bandrabouensis]MCG6145944.1 GMC family oxidoreductase [Leptospira bandrabouensis]MCG6165531.1 GMC family oxidoreductase [Leptospira bandrabouensis]
MKTIWEWKDYKESQEIRTKVCIIGSGCGGATLARELLLAGIDTIILEKGGFYPTATFDNWELNMAGKISGERNLQMDTHYQANLIYGNNVGGASVHYWADSYRTPIDRLNLWEEKFGIRNHTDSDLKPYWPVLEERLNVHLPKEEYYNRMNQKLRLGSNTLGWSGHPVPQARKNCQKSGHCMQGCAFGAKQSQLVTHIDEFIRNQGRLFSDMEADGFELIRSEKRSKVKVLLASPKDRASGKKMDLTFRIHADIFVIAAGGFQSSALLLSNGLKKDLPALGEFFGMNASPMVHALFDEEMISYRNIPAAFGIDEFRNARFFPNGNYKEGGFMLMANQLQPATLASMIPSIGEEHFRWMKSLNQIGGTIGWIDDPEEELGRIEWKSNTKKVIAPDGPKTRKVMLDLIEKQVHLNFAVGAKEVLIPTVSGIRLTSLRDLQKIKTINLGPHSLLMAAPHPFGGCRMGENPKNSVVNSEHRVHRFENLFVADSSVFPTGPSVDPSFTIMAFSLRLADHLKEILK